jgi:hypothetical protein
MAAAASRRTALVKSLKRIIALMRPRLPIGQGIGPSVRPTISTHPPRSSITIWPQRKLGIAYLPSRQKQLAPIGSHAVCVKLGSQHAEQAGLIRGAETGFGPSLNGGVVDVLTVESGYVAGRSIIGCFAQGPLQPNNDAKQSPTAEREAAQRPGTQPPKL